MIKRIPALFLLLTIISAPAAQAFFDDNEVNFSGGAVQSPVFCNSTRKSKQKSLAQRFPKDEGILKVYAVYLGLCQMVASGDISEDDAALLWDSERARLIDNRRRK